MALQSQRFQGNATLEACVNDGYRMLRGEPDHDAVRRLQAALEDLGYPVRGGLDGIFGEGTEEAVVAFKIDELLEPHDAVASTGTIGRLDQYFAHEVSDPDSPDPSADGLSDLVHERMVEAVAWLTAAIDALNQFPSGELHFEDPNWVDFDNRLQRNFHVIRSPLGRERAIEEIILPVFHQAKRALSAPSPFFVTTSLDRGLFRATFPGEDYMPVRERIGGQLFISPPFRNAMLPDEQVATLIRFGAGVDGRVNLFAVPESPRQQHFTGNDGMRNTMAYAAFAFETTHASGAWVLHARHRWPAPQ